MRRSESVVVLLGLALTLIACEPRQPAPQKPPATTGVETSGTPPAAPAATPPAAGARPDVAAHDAFLDPDSSAFAAHPVAMWKGPLAAPVITDDVRSWRTRIREAGSGGVNFAGVYTLLRFGCGTGCTSALVIDRRDGAVLDFPLGGEDYVALEITVRPDSELVRSAWEGPYPAQECFLESWLWRDGRLTSLGDRKAYPKAPDANCPFGFER